MALTIGFDISPMIVRMGLTFRRSGHERVASDEHWTYSITSYHGEHVVEIKSKATNQAHRRSMYTKRGAEQLARHFHRLGEDFDPAEHEGRTRFEQARADTDMP